MSEAPAVTDQQAARTAQAADWFVRLSADDVAESDLAEWLRWCADAANAHEFDRVRDTWAALDRLGPHAARLLDDLDGGRGAPGASLTPTADRPRARTPRHLRWVAAAAAVAGLVVAGTWYGREAGWLPSSQRVVAASLANRSTMLPDGSTLTLAPRTQIAVDFTGPTRSLALSHGEAYFKVHSDKAKSFVVHTDAVTVTAVGTAFDVRSEPGRAVVTVYEGIVSVAGVGHDAAPGGNWRVSAGYQVIYDTKLRDVRLSAVDPLHAFDWRSGRLQYFDEPLGSVVADVARYSVRPIEVADNDVADLRFTGTVFTNSVDEWLTAIQSTFPVRAVVTKDNRVLLIGRATDHGPAQAAE